MLAFVILLLLLIKYVSKIALDVVSCLKLHKVTINDLRVAQPKHRSRPLADGVEELNKER